MAVHFLEKRRNKMGNRIIDEMKIHNETWEDVVSYTPDELDESHPFTLWTHKRVYFPCCYDGDTWVESVPRNPSDEITEFKGG